MHPKNHPLLRDGNLLELLLQSLFWVFFYGTGLIFFLQLSTWVVYGLGWYIHPRRYPMPHAAFMDLFAESILWLRKESEFGQRHRLLCNALVYSVTHAAIIGFPYLFIVYFHYLTRLYLNGPVSAFQAIWNAL